MNGRLASASKGAIDTGTLQARRSVLGSEMVIISTPVDKILSTISDIAPYLKKGCIVIDVGSVKEAIVSRAERILGAKRFFVGTHPMAGSEQRGIDQADVSLFNGSLCIVAKTRKTNRAALTRVVGLWKALGSAVCLLSPLEHDKKIIYKSDRVKLYYQYEC